MYISPYVQLVFVYLFILLNTVSILAISVLEKEDAGDRMATWSRQTPAKGMAAVESKC